MEKYLHIELNKIRKLNVDHIVISCRTLVCIPIKQLLDCSKLFTKVSFKNNSSSWNDNCKG